MDRTVSHYRILEQLGRGGMGVVYKARDTKLDRVVALKFLSKHLLCDEEARTRFVREAKAASALNHPNIATIYEIDEVEGECFISMEYVEGKSLKQLIKEGQIQGWDSSKMLDLTIQIAEGLSKAHQKGIVHRDIKSDNIMLTSENLGKIMDFGLAKLRGVTQVTQTGTKLGTVAYMSPEQARGKTLDQRTDIWSLGVVLYEMLTGQLPFGGEHDGAVIHCILNEEPKPATGLRKEAQRGLNAIIHKSLKKDPAQRYQTMAQMLTDLQAVKKGESITEELPIGRRGYRLQNLSLFIAAALVVATVLAVLFARKELYRLVHELFFPEEISKTSVGVMFFDNQTNEEKYDYLRKALADMLITDLSQSRYLQVMSFPRMFDLLQSMGYGDVEIIDASVGFELCKSAGARVMVMGSLAKSGETFVINTQVLNVDTKKLIAAQTETGEGENSILGHLVDDLTDRIKKDMEISAREIQQEQKNITELTTTSLEAYRYFVMGKEAGSAGYNQEAIDDLQKAVALDSSFIEAYDALVRQYYTVGESEKALRVCEKLKTIATQSTRATQEKLLEVLVLEALIKEHWDLAVAYLRKITSMNPENVRAHIDLGMVYYQKKKMYDEGIAEFKKVLELDPQGMKPRVVDFTYKVLGYAYLRKGELGKAEAAFKTHVDLSPNQPLPLLCLGEFYLIVGNYDQALARLKQSLEAKPDFVDAHACLGDIYLAKGRYAEALRSYERYLALSTSESEKADAHFLLGKLKYLKNDYTEAVQESRQALRLDPKMPQAHWMLGLALIKKTMFSQAEIETLAISELMKKTEADEPKVYYYHLLGEFWLSRGLHQRALENFNKAASIPILDRAFFINTLGEAHYKMGEWDAAVEQFEAVLKTNPSYAQTHYLLGLLYEKKGTDKKSRQHFQKFIEIWEDADEDLPQLTDAKKRLEEL